jgi:aromatic ring-opening dioxygenase catalytic subunit (LigB family)
MQSIVFNHGPGGTPELRSYLTRFAKSLPSRPTAVIVVEAHMQSDPVKICSPDKNFSNRVAVLLRKANIPSVTMNNYGSGHGAEDARQSIGPVVGQDVPFLTLSLRSGQNATEHLALGLALAPLRSEDVLIMGSGVSSFHNFEYIMSRSEKIRDEGLRHSQIFDNWIRATLCDVHISSEDRLDALRRWEESPSAHVAQPAGAVEHFLPLLVVAGAARGAAAVACDENPYGNRFKLQSTNFIFE